jgi:hypothetical protein
MKKICAIIIAAGFLATAFPFMADAAQPSSRQKLLKQSIAGLQQKIYAEDSSELSAVTIQFLDDILAAGLANNKADLQLAVMRYVADVQQIQATLALDNETKCLIPFGISAGSGAVGMITEVTSGDSAFCIVINLTNKVADIMVAQAKYQICLIDTAGGSGDRAALVQKQKSFAIYNFATSAMDLFLCNPAPTVQDYIGPIFDFIGIFTIK